ncbi:2-oxoacid:acceptor oxidoreductase subunit alpha [Legionella longbeachae]|uniref:Putative 2-oxoglutarate ferredoxin oxidoreductase alpha subunit n=1 Tax=Legionella longbeachae serogroup 1 (strain NSW150) TaxID=661367 RepID=D3HIV3_LEGLN|nr:2-oxoacid:acceptor oxidoreductase subunit alpha [Legionella longbeachae]VEE02841.1 2-oxoglutarate ferredoxin oxidoreductase subunit alpha [Legionella oakridgensis]HBD7398016.1 2-oxoacid:acceptor oxidoreductase subunit alpha [Legionella pneumophila]ARB90915.1 2-oxoacid:acceptor oxidoreductase subunit alpha [Legionella longbeachae]ARM32653.1 2-oxoacid:acceptor oxidoreductase subunit alpha [Legionella longbeachae]EEZ94569.1 2-oxoglutarate ferredoxin oxidoreductase alpha subunit [Legionella lon
MSTTDVIVIRITGDSGDGVQLVGEQLTLSAALTGRDVRTLPDFPAEIRAPAGTISGVSGFQLAMAEHAIFTAGESLDVLVALNPAALKNSLQYLNQGGLLIINEDSYQVKDWQKAGIDKSFLDNCSGNYQIISFPLITQTLQAVNSLELTKPQATKAKNFYILGLVLWLFDLPTAVCEAFIAKKFKTNIVIAQANQLALLAGYNYAMTLELSRRDYMLGEVRRETGEYRQITGVEAVGLALATLATSTQVPMLVSGYPITPSSAILHECARLTDFGVQLLQAEDEIAAICACIGAAYGGRLALTTTSGPGLDLKSESLGLAVAAELPLVVLDVQRAGVSTGLPTKTSQSDLRQALYGRHGEAPLPVLAAQSAADCFYTVLEAFYLAIKYMTPVIVLLDAYLANAAEPWKIPEMGSLKLPKIEFNRFPKPFMRDEFLSRSWNKPGTPGHIHQLGGLEKQGDDGRVSYDAENHQKMVHLRQQKINGIAREYNPMIIEGNVNASILLIGWGSTYGSLKSTVLQCSEQGLAIAYIHLRNLNPLPNDLGELLKKYSKVFVAELNSGHLCQILRATYLVDVQAISQTNGQPFTVSYLVNTLKTEVHYE